MKKFSTAKILSLVFVCVMLLGAFALTAFATEGENVDIVTANIVYGDTYQIVFAVDAPEGATVGATHNGEAIEVVPFDKQPTVNVNGVECKAYVLTKGVSAQAIDEVITLSVEYNGKKVSKNYSVLQYVYTRTAALVNKADKTEKDLAEIDMLNALLAYAIKADAYFNGASEYTFDAYKYVKATGVTVNGIVPSGMYAPGSAPFANIDAIEYDADKYELSCTINGEAATLDAVKAIVVGENDVVVTVEIVEKAHQHSYTPKVTDPTCTADGYTTFTCECGDSYTEPGETATGHSDNDENFKCDNCPELLLPEEGEVLTLAQANAIGKLFEHNTYSEQKYYVVGFITEVYNTTYGNMYITDGTDKFTVYGVYMNGVRYDAMTTKPQVNDEITVYAAIGNYNGNAQMKNAEIDDFIVHECEYYYTEQVTKPTCTADGYTTYTCDVCGDSYTGNETDALGHKFVDGVCSECGVADTHTHNYTPKVTDPTCTADGYTTYTCEECGDSYTDNKTDALGHIDENEDFKCERCSQKALPAADSVLTLEQAIKIAKLYAHNTYTTDKYYVTATIKDVYNTQYGNMYLTDGTNEFTVYGTYSADGKTGYSSLSVKPVKGDTVTIYGIIGTYSNAAQIKNGWITEHIAHECDFSVAATCTKGASCSLCGAVQEGSEPIDHDFTYAPATCETPAKCVCGAKDEGSELGHNLGDDGKCTREGCDYQEGVESEPKELATFEFGANGSASHVDGNDLGTSKSYTENGYTLALTGMSKVYGPAYDAKGNSCIKLGTSKVVGSFTFTVDDDVDQVIIRVAKYKSNTTKINVNGTAYTISGASNSGAYDEIVIDTTTTKTITFATVSGGVRAMINSITFIG